MTCELGDGTCGWRGGQSRQWRRGQPLCDEHRFERHLHLLDGMVSKANTVYYASRDGQVKIGSSRNPAQRCRGLRARLLAVEPGTAFIEGKRHRQFRDVRVPGTNEWFRGDDPALLAHIAALAAASGTAPVEATA